MEWDSLQAGIASGISQVTIGYPLDSIKTWMQNNKFSKRPKTTFRNLYRGLQFPLIQSPFTIASGFFTNDTVYKHTNNAYISAFCSGLCVSFFLCPFDYYKICYQQQIKPNIFNSYGRIHIVAMREIPANLIYFPTYFYLRENNFTPGIAGAITGVCSWSITYPIDTIKSRLQLNSSMTLKNALSGGGLYNGLAIASLRAAIVNYVGFEIYETVKNELKFKTHELKL